MHAADKVHDNNWISYTKPQCYRRIRAEFAGDAGD